MRSNRLPLGAERALSQTIDYVRHRDQENISRQSYISAVDQAVVLTTKKFCKFLDQRYE